MSLGDILKPPADSVPKQERLGPVAFTLSKTKKDLVAAVFDDESTSSYVADKKKPDDGAHFLNGGWRVDLTQPTQPDKLWFVLLREDGKIAGRACVTAKGRAREFEFADHCQRKVLSCSCGMDDPTISDLPNKWYYDSEREPSSTIQVKNHLGEEQIAALFPTIEKVPDFLKPLWLLRQTQLDQSPARQLIRKIAARMAKSKLVLLLTDDFARKAAALEDFARSVAPAMEVGRTPYIVPPISTEDDASQLIRRAADAPGHKFVLIQPWMSYLE